MRGQLGIRLLGVALALVAAAIHLALAVTDLIPGESTRGPAFAATGVGLLACAAGLLARRAVADILVALFAGALILAYVATRDERPVEAIGLTSKAAELGLAAVAAFLSRRDEDLPL